MRDVAAGLTRQSCPAISTDRDPRHINRFQTHRVPPHGWSEKVKEEREAKTYAPAGSREKKKERPFSRGMSSELRKSFSLTPESCSF